MSALKSRVEALEVEVDLLHLELNRVKNGAEPKTSLVDDLLAYPKFLANGAADAASWVWGKVPSIKLPRISVEW